MHVFNSPLGTKYAGPGGMKRSFATACRRAAISGLRFHDLRHTAATRMIEAGASIVDVAKILGPHDAQNDHETRASGRVAQNSSGVFDPVLS